MAHLKNVITGMIAGEMRKISHPCQGRIPAGGIDYKNWTCTIHIPNPHGGIHPAKDTKGAADRQLVFHHVPLPKSPGGFIQAILQTVLNKDRAVTVGFKGGNLYQPYIINFLSLLNQFDDREEQKTENRQPNIANRTLTAAPAKPPAAGALTSTQGFIGPPAPPSGPSSPSSQQAKQKIQERTSLLNVGLQAQVNRVLAQQVLTLPQNRQ